MSQQLQNWYKELNKFEDAIPCPYCLNGCGLVNYRDVASPEATAFNCRNESCYVYSEWILLQFYFDEFQRVLHLNKQGYFKFPKKVIKFAEDMIKK